MSIYEKKFGQRVDSTIIEAAISLISQHKVAQQGVVRVLDVGCGDMTLTSMFHTKLMEHTDIQVADIRGWDISNKGVALAKSLNMNAYVRDITKPLGIEEVAQYDIILLLDVIDYLVDTDAALQNLRTLLKPNGILILSTPNLASWYNRLFLLVGNQPHCTEVSYAPVRFGNRIVHKLLGEVEGETDIAAGHLRVFTWKALREYLSYFKFRILKAKGCSNHKKDIIGRILSKLSVGFAGDICVMVERY